MRITESRIRRIIREELKDHRIRDLRELTGNYLLDFLELEGAWEIVEAIRNPTEPDSLIYVWNEVFAGGKRTYREWSYDFPLDGWGVQGVPFEEMGIRNARIRLVIDAEVSRVAGAASELEDYGAPSAGWFRDYVNTDIEIRVPDFDVRRGRPAGGKTIPLIKLFSGSFKGEIDSTGNYRGYFGEAPRLALVMPPRAEGFISWFLRRRAAITLETIIRRQVRGMRITESRIRRIIREELESSDGNPEIDRKVAIAIAGLAPRDYSFAEHVRAVDGSMRHWSEAMDAPVAGDPLREALAHARRIERLVDMKRDKGLVRPMSFTRHLVNMIWERNRKLADKIMREDTRSDIPGWGAHASWDEGMEGILEGVKLMSPFLYGQPRNTRFMRNVAPSYLKGVRMIEDNIDEVDRYMELMDALPRLVDFFVSNDDEELEDTFIKLALGGSVGAVQAAMLLP